MSELPGVFVHRATPTLLFAAISGIDTFELNLERRVARRNSACCASEIFTETRFKEDGFPAELEGIFAYCGRCRKGQTKDFLVFDIEDSEAWEDYFHEKGFDVLAATVLTEHLFTEITHHDPNALNGVTDV